eukprot:10851-Heterococcus_DN1.PRE.1
MAVTAAAAVAAVARAVTVAMISSSGSRQHKLYTHDTHRKLTSTGTRALLATVTIQVCALVTQKMQYTLLL